MGFNGADMLVRTSDDAIFGARLRRASVPMRYVGEQPLGIARLGDWLLVHYADAGGPTPEVAVNASRKVGERVVMVHYSSVADVYAFQVCDAGAQLRSAAWVEREQVETHGTPLPEEADLPWVDDPEEAIFALVERLTGVRLDALDDSGPVMYPLKRKRWWHR